MKARRHVRRLVFAHASRFTPLLAVERDGLTLLLETWDRGLGRKLFVGGKRKEMAALGRAVAALDARGRSTVGKTLVDVGANIGTTCLAGLAWHGFASAVAIEPDARNAQLLRASAELNGLADRLTVIQAAAAATIGESTLVRSRKNSGAHRVRAGGTPIATITLDSLDLDPAEIGIVWIDVQGSETAVLAGATRLLEHGVPIVIEVSGDLELDGYQEWAAINETSPRFRPLPVIRDRKVLDVLVI